MGWQNSSLAHCCAGVVYPSMVDAPQATPQSSQLLFPCHDEISHVVQLDAGGCLEMQSSGILALLHINTDLFLEFAFYKASAMTY